MLEWGILPASWRETGALTWSGEGGSLGSRVSTEGVSSEEKDSEGAKRLTHGPSEALRQGRTASPIPCLPLEDSASPVSTGLSAECSSFPVQALTCPGLQVCVVLTSQSGCRGRPLKVQFRHCLWKGRPLLPRPAWVHTCWFSSAQVTGSSTSLSRGPWRAVLTFHPFRSQRALSRPTGGTRNVKGAGESINSSISINQPISQSMFSPRRGLSESGSLGLPVMRRSYFSPSSLSQRAAGGGRGALPAHLTLHTLAAAPQTRCPRGLLQAGAGGPVSQTMFLRPQNS